MISHPDGLVARWPAAGVRQWEWLLAAGFLAVVTVMAFSPVMTVLMGQWATNDTYSFGVLVPPIAAYFVWMQRHRVSRLQVKPSPWTGALLVAFCAALLAFGRAIGVIGVQEIAMVLMVSASIWLLCGRRFVFALWFPLLYLLLMLPIWEILTDRFHYQSQLFSAQLGERLLTAAGIPVHRSETYLELPNITLEVASVCSGVNFLVAVIAIGVPQAYLFLFGWVPRAIVIGFAMAIAIFSNGLRIAIIGFLSHYELTKEIHGPGHILQGLFVSGAGLIALQVAVAYMARRYPKPQPAVQPTGSGGLAVSRWQLVTAVSAASIFVFAAANLQPRALSASSIASADDLPTTSAASPLFGPGLPIQFIEGGPQRNLARTYRSGSGKTVEVYAGDLAFAERSGGLGYRRVSLPTRAALSEMPIQTGDGPIFVNSVSFQTNDQNTDVVFWYDLNGSVTSQVTTAKLRTLWRLLTGERPLPRLIVVSRTRAGSNDVSEPLEQVVADVIHALKLEQ